MAKAAIDTGQSAQPVHTRTTAGTEESQAVVVGVDGSDSVVGTPAPADSKANPANALDVGAHGLLWNGTTWDRAPGNAASGLKVQSGQLPSGLVSGRLDVNLGAITGSSIPVGNVETLVDNAGFTDGTSKVFPMGMILDEAAGTALTENDVAAPRMDSKRASISVLEDTTTRGRRAIITALGAMLNAGDTAHDAVDGGDPVKTGAKATWPALPTPVASGDRTNNWSDLGGAQIIRKRPVAMYTAGYRLANATAGARIGTTAALTANTTKQMMTIYHAASATKRVQIKYAALTISAVSPGGFVEIEMIRLTATTAPATGNPAITPTPHDSGDTAAEATCLYLPTTQGSSAGDQPIGLMHFANWGTTGAGGVSSPPPTPLVLVFWDSRSDGDGKDPTMRSGVAEGYGITVRSPTAVQLSIGATIIFTEE